MTSVEELTSKMEAADIAPPCKLATKCDGAIDRTIKHTLNIVKKCILQGCESTTDDTEIVEKLAEEFRTKTEERIKVRLAAVKSRLKLDEKLREVEKMRRDQRRFEGEKAWRPSGVAEDDVASRSLQVMSNYEDSLKKLQSQEGLERDKGREKLHELANTASQTSDKLQLCAHKLNMDLLSLEEQLG